MRTDLFIIPESRGQDVRRTQLIRGLGVALVAAALATGCSGGHHAASAAAAGSPTPGAGTAVRAGASSAPTPSPADSSAADPSTAAPAVAASSGYPTSPAAPGAAVPLVRDSFAVLQATYNDSCGSTAANCEYFLDRLLTNLDDLQNSMKASSKGVAHFRQPLAWIGQMQTTLAGDISFDNLRKHQSLLVATRDRINAWMQSYPDDYR